MTALVRPGAASTPCSCRIPRTWRAIQASPAAEGCRPSGACAKVQPAASGSMMITWWSAAVPAVTIAWSVRYAAAERFRPGNTVSSAIRACGAAAQMVATTCPTRCASSGAVPGLHDHQRRPERAQADPRDLGGHRSLAAHAGPYVAGPRVPVHHGVPVQLAGQQHGPRLERVTRPDTGGERGADDGQPRQAASGALLDLVFAAGQRGAARLHAARLYAGRRSAGTRCARRLGREQAREERGAGHRRRPRRPAGRSRCGRRQQADWQQGQAADCDDGSGQHGISPEHGLVSALSQIVSSEQLGSQGGHVATAADRG
jgi:hypothetical protein